MIDFVTRVGLGGVRVRVDVVSPVPALEGRRGGVGTGNGGDWVPDDGHGDLEGLLRELVGREDLEEELAEGSKVLLIHKDCGESLEEIALTLGIHVEEILGGVFHLELAVGGVADPVEGGRGGGNA